VSTWLKKLALALVLLGFLDVMARLAWAMLKPAAPILLLAAVALVVLLRIFKRPEGW
jgi:hypothetical protein